MMTRVTVMTKPVTWQIVTTGNSSNNNSIQNKEQARHTENGTNNEKQ